jgi:large subunit ribosomal protein L28
MKKQPAAVHYVPKEGRFQRNEKTGEISAVQNIPIPLKYVTEENYGIWGGEAVIQGFKKKLMRHRNPHFWVPTLKRSAVRSEVLNSFFSVTVTDRTISLIHDHHGFDHYLLKSPACDLRSMLALKIKRNILTDLLNGCPAWDHDKTRKDEVMREFSQYLQQYSPEEIEWYGLSYAEALKKISNKIKAENMVIPHKLIFREKLIEQLKEAGLDEVTGEKTMEE